MAGMRVLARWRAAVETFPLGGAFPTAAYTARYDSPAASGGRSRSQASPACLGSQERRGPPKFCDGSLPACHGLRTPAVLPILAKSDALVRPAVYVPTLGVRHKPLRSGTSTSGGAVTPAASRRLCRRLVHRVRRDQSHDSAMDARLATGGG
jgi:hypothetical protein